MLNSDTQFPGQQADERILYCFRPHKFKKFAGLVNVVLITAALIALFAYAAQTIDVLQEDWLLYGYAAIALLAAVLLWWHLRWCATFRAYITDRRVMRFEAVFPVMEKRRALYWTEVTKAKGVAPNFLWRMMNVGTVEVMPFVSDLENLELTYAHYFEDLASYIDKLVFLRKSNSSEIANVRPFVARPYGKRYPAEEAAEGKART